MVEYWNLSVPGVDGTAERRAYLYLPACYHAEQERRFPVLSMFHGRNVFFQSHVSCCRNICTPPGRRSSSPRWRETTAPPPSGSPNTPPTLSATRALGT